MSVLRPGTALMRWALTSSISICPSRMFQTGSHNTPVDSIATCYTCSDCDPSASSTDRASWCRTVQVFLLLAVLFGNQHASGDWFLVNIEFATAGIENVHRGLLGPPDWTPSRFRISLACSRQRRGDNCCSQAASWLDFTPRLRGTRSHQPLLPDGCRRAHSNWPPFFFLRCERSCS